jgi:hypothetical protein
MTKLLTSINYLVNCRNPENNANIHSTGDGTASSMANLIKAIEAQTQAQATNFGAPDDEMYVEQDEELNAGQPDTVHINEFAHILDQNKCTDGLGSSLASSILESIKDWNSPAQSKELMDKIKERYNMYGIYI